MAQLIVRNLDQEIVKQLKRKAVESGRSTEAEHRAILREALLVKKQGKSLKQRLLDMPNVGRDEDFARVQDKGRKAPL